MESNEREPNAIEKAPAILEGPIALMPEEVRMRLGIVKTDRGWEMPLKWIKAMLSMATKEQLIADIAQKKVKQPEPAKPRAPLKKRKQHKFWFSVKLFEALLRQLTINGFIDEDSTENWKAIYDNHFTGEKERCGEGNKINWMASPAVFKYFFDKFYGEYFDGNPSWTVFFEAHFLHNGKGKSAGEIKKRNKCPDNSSTKLDRIFANLENMKMKESYK